MWLTEPPAGAHKRVKEHTPMRWICPCNKVIERTMLPVSGRVTCPACGRELRIDADTSDALPLAMSQRPDDDELLRPAAPPATGAMPNTAEPPPEPAAAGRSASDEIEDLPIARTTPPPPKPKPVARPRPVAAESTAPRPADESTSEGDDHLAALASAIDEPPEVTAARTPVTGRATATAMGDAAKGQPAPAAATPKRDVMPLVFGGVAVLIFLIVVVGAIAMAVGGGSGKPTSQKTTSAESPSTPMTPEQQPGLAGSASQGGSGSNPGDFGLFPQVRGNRTSADYQKEQEEKKRQAELEAKRQQQAERRARQQR